MRRGEHLQIQGPHPQLIQDSVPVVVAFTKFDVVILIEGKNPQDHEKARANAYARCEESCRSLFRKDPGDVPAEIVQGSSGLLSVALMSSFVCSEFTIG